MNTDYCGLDLYMDKVSLVSLLTRDEEFYLGNLAKEGNENAIQKLIEANLRLVVKIAHDFKGLGVPLNDLISEGNIGLMIAARKFDPSKGAKFSSYSSLWIKQAIRNAVANIGRTIRIPINSLSKISKIYLARIKLSKKFNREPTVEELADYLQLPIKSVSNLLKVNIQMLSLNKTYNPGKELQVFVEDEGNCPPYEKMILNENLSTIKDSWHRLKEREKQILEWRFGLGGKEPMTLQKISDIMGITRERVRQIQQTAIKRIKMYFLELENH